MVLILQQKYVLYWDNIKQPLKYKLITPPPPLEYFERNHLNQLFFLYILISFKYMNRNLISFVKILMLTESLSRRKKRRQNSYLFLFPFRFKTEVPWWNLSIPCPSWSIRTNGYM